MYKFILSKQNEEQCLQHVHAFVSDDEAERGPRVAVCASSHREPRIRAELLRVGVEAAHHHCIYSTVHTIPDHTTP